MTDETITTQRKLEEVDGLIEILRQTARDGDDDRRIAVFKAIALDLRGRLDRAPGVALVELERRMTAMRRRPRAGSSRVNAMIGVAEELVCRWPTVKQALEKFANDA